MIMVSWFIVGFYCSIYDSLRRKLGSNGNHLHLIFCCFWLTGFWWKVHRCRCSSVHSPYFGAWERTLERHSPLLFAWGLCLLSWCTSSHEEGALVENRGSGPGASCVGRTLLVVSKRWTESVGAVGTPSGGRRHSRHRAPVTMRVRAAQTCVTVLSGGRGRSRTHVFLFFLP